MAVVDTIKVRREEVHMKKLYTTVTGTKYYLGKEFFKEGKLVHPVKEPDNQVDKEAIKAEMEGSGTIGYVTNSPYTVAGDSYSAGRQYDPMGMGRRPRCSMIFPKRSCACWTPHCNG